MGGLVDEGRLQRVDVEVVNVHSENVVEALGKGRGRVVHGLDERQEVCARVALLVVRQDAVNSVHDETGVLARVRTQVGNDVLDPETQRIDDELDPDAIEHRARGEGLMVRNLLHPLLVRRGEGRRSARTPHNGLKRLPLQARVVYEISPRPAHVLQEINLVDEHQEGLHAIGHVSQS